MPRKATGVLIERNGQFFARVWVGAKQRKQVALRGAKSREFAASVAMKLASMLRALRDANEPEHITKTIELVSKVTTREQLDAIEKTVANICSGELVKVRTREQGPTFREVALQWTSGELAKKYPEHARVVDSMSANEQRLRDYVLPIVGDIAISAFAIDDALRVLEHLPKRLSPGTRRHVCQIMYRVCALAVWPLRTIAISPLPKGFVPKKAKPKARAFLFPDEEAKVLANTNADLQLRVLVGFLNREGLRKDEAATLEWSDLREPNAAGWLNLEKGWLYLDKNKTDDVRDWPLSEGVCEALREWRKHNPRSRFVFPNGENDGPMYTDKLAAQFRDLVRASGIDRSELFDSNEQRQRINAHDMRGIFVTTSLAIGKSEAWVMRRTGHTTSEMLQKYRRHAANLEEVGKAQLARLDEAIPELNKTKKPDPSNGSGTRSGTSVRAKPSFGRKMMSVITRKNKARMRRKGLEPSCLSTLEPKNEIEQTPAIYSALSDGDLAKHRQGLPHVANSAPIQRAYAVEASTGSQPPLNEETKHAPSEVVARLSSLVIEATKRGDFVAVSSLVSAIEALLAASPASPAQPVNVPSVSN